MTALVMNVNIVQWMNGNQKIKLKNSKMHFFVPRSLDIFLIVQLCCTLCTTLRTICEFVHVNLDVKKSFWSFVFMIRYKNQFICYLLFPDTNRDWQDDSKQHFPIWFPVCRSCSMGQWRYRRVE